MPPQETSLSVGHTTIQQILENPAAKAVLDEHVPGMADDPRLAMAADMTLKQIAPFAPQVLTEAALAAIDRGLAELEPIEGSPLTPSSASEANIQRAITVHQPDRCDPSYVLYNSRNLEIANLIDLEGHLIHSWSYPQGFTWHYVELLPNGHLAAIVKETEGVDPGMVIELDWQSNLVRRFDVPAHHDFCFLGNGNVVILCRE